jgi:hypothetical protein
MPNPSRRECRMGHPSATSRTTNNVDGFSDEDAESVQDDEGPPYAMVGQDEISQKEEQEEKIVGRNH